MRRLEKWRGIERVEENLAPYEEALREINRLGEDFARKTDDQLREIAALLRERMRESARGGVSSDELLVEVFALAREAAARALGMRPFDVQVIAGVALSSGKLVEMQTGEGKTLAAVLPACLNAATGRGVHVLTFNDYLARRDAAWMGPVYRFLGLSVGVIQEGMSVDARRAAYAADVTYATAKEAGFDFLRFYVDGVPVASWSGTTNTGWQLYTYTLPAGAHTLKWAYEKDASASLGQDAAWIDAVTLP